MHELEELYGLMTESDVVKCKLDDMIEVHCKRVGNDNLKFLVSNVLGNVKRGNDDYEDVKAEQDIIDMLEKNRYSKDIIITRLLIAYKIVNTPPSPIEQFSTYVRKTLLEGCERLLLIITKRLK